MSDDIFGDVIYAYTRAQAIEDGVLVDVSELAQEAGYKVSVALTASVNVLIKKADENKNVASSYDGVLWDILFMSTRCYHEVNESTRLFVVQIVGAGRKRKYQFKACAHAGDNGECCVTIMLPDED